MPIVRIDPPKKKGRTFFDAVKGVARFYVNPVGTIISANNESKATPNEVKEMYGTLPLELDTATGVFSAVHIPTGKGKGAIVAGIRNATADQAAAALSQVYYTGVVPKVLPPGYRAAATIAAQLKTTDPPDWVTRDYSTRVDQEPAPVQTPPTTNDWNNPMGIIPPGGYAGFSQMTPASRLALTRGVRGGGSGRRKKRRKTKTKTTKRRKKRSGGKKARLVKGSAAAKRYMASIRRKRRK